MKKIKIILAMTLVILMSCNQISESYSKNDEDKLNYKYKIKQSVDLSTHNILDNDYILTTEFGDIYYSCKKGSADYIDSIKCFEYNIADSIKRELYYLQNKKCN